jgi:hypothetical protein
MGWPCYVHKKPRRSKERRYVMARIMCNEANVGCLLRLNLRGVRPATNRLCIAEACRLPKSRRRWSNTSFRLTVRACLEYLGWRVFGMG